MHVVRLMTAMGGLAFLLLAPLSAVSQEHHPAPTPADSAAAPDSNAMTSMTMTPGPLGEPRTREGSGTAWLVMLTRSRCLDRIRARDARKRAEDPVRQASRLVVSPDPVAEDEAARVRRALARIPDEQRELLEMAYFSGMSQSELAEHFRIPLGTVKTRMRLGLWHLKNLLKGSQT